HGLVHITGDGFANLCRLEADVTYKLEELPPALPIFDLIQSAGHVTDAEMYRVFNMGIGFIALVDASDAATALEAAGARGYGAFKIGSAMEGPRRVAIEPVGLVGTLDGGESSFEQT
ncbi:MAG: phosphoribosylformylglycinamidine cyclo-ligase, partial [Actinomycetota bacterium]|nr:phosphoribosylformylglycinamidine cyclo-ligase [Actinomycetota bacterium]